MFSRAQFLPLIGTSTVCQRGLGLQQPRSSTQPSDRLRRTTGLRLTSAASLSLGRNHVWLRMRNAPTGRAVRHSCSRIRQNSDVGRNSAELWRVQLRLRARFFVIQNASQRCPSGRDGAASSPGCRMQTYSLSPAGPIPALPVSTEAGEPRVDPVTPFTPSVMSRTDRRACIGWRSAYSLRSR